MMDSLTLEFLLNGPPMEARGALAEALMHDALTSDELARCVTAARRLGLVPALVAAFTRCADRGATADELVSLGAAAMEAEAHAEAVRLFRRAATAAPQSADAHAALGGALMRCGAKDEARAALERAIMLEPAHAAAQKTLGSLKLEDRDFDGAIAAMSAAVVADPENPAYRVSLGWALQGKGMYEEAFLIIESALELDQAYGPAFSALADLFWDVRDFERSLKYFRLAAEHHPCAATITPYLFNLLASDARSDEEIFDEHKRFGGVFDSPAGTGKRHRNAPDPDRRLKIGFVSGDFYHHSTARFVTPLFTHIDRRRFEIHAIYNNTAEDPVTAKLRELVDCWFVCHGLSDQAVAEWIEARRIDILIDLSGHTNLQRLGVFGLRPAPVQATYLGYPGTTGMNSMDYRITCARIDPPGIGERLHTEKLVRLPGLVAPFEPMAELDPGDPPCLGGAPFTFACMTPPWRITPSVVRAWARILHARPDARLILANVNEPIVAHHLIASFAQEGVEAARLLPVPRQKLETYLQLHRDIDLGLDTFPFNGGTTTTYSLWMGVPVVTLAGARPAARSGACILGEAGLEEFVARDVDGYVERALDWAARPQDLQRLRRTMRDRLKVSHDHAQHAAQFGDALAAMWREWCARAPGAVQRRAAM